MSHVDVAVQIAARGGAPPSNLPALPPAHLLKTYCQPGMAGGFRASERRERSEWHAGFIGWTGGPLGYDEGHSYAEALIGAGWLARPEIGAWPYVIYLVWPARPSHPRYAIAHYCQGDFGVEVFDDRSAIVALLRSLRQQTEEECDD